MATPMGRWENTLCCQPFARVIHHHIKVTGLLGRPLTGNLTGQNAHCLTPNVKFFWPRTVGYGLGSRPHLCCLHRDPGAASAGRL